METFKSPRGRTMMVLGDPALLTMDRLAEFGSRVDRDPRIATLSLVPTSVTSGTWLRSTAPAGCLVAIARDLQDLVGELDETAPQAWFHAASGRGLHHDWWLTNSRDVLRAEPIITPAQMDSLELTDPSSARFHVAQAGWRPGSRLSLAVDATWLGPHETGAQVLTTAAVDALAQHERIREILLVGLTELPPYAQHLAAHENVRLADPTDTALPADIVWYPNQIDGRSNIADSRRLGRRVVATYLDLIAYDIPRYHGSPEAWATYRGLQRKVALSVDGISTISADVAKELLGEVPLLDADRVRAIPLGLDHIVADEAPATPPEELAATVKSLRGHPFLLVLGNDFVHKNRDFAIAAWQEVLRMGEPCDLILAGLHVRGSSSKEFEDDLLARHVDLRGKAYTLGHVSSESRAWLLANAGAVLYPSSAEGFGFVPYEAAALGTPTTFTAFGPLREIAGPIDVPTNWSVPAYAADMHGLLTDPAKAERRVVELRSAIDTYTWAVFAEQLVELFASIAERPPVAASAVTGGAADTAALSAILSSRTWRATEPLRRVGRRLRRS